MEYVELAGKYKPLNLGQGFADFSPPKYITDALSQVALSSNPLFHQYTRGFVSKILKIFNAIIYLLSSSILKFIFTL